MVLRMVRSAPGTVLGGPAIGVSYDTGRTIGSPAPGLLRP